MKTCPKCGNTCEDNVQFCSECGHKFTSDQKAGVPSWVKIVVPLLALLVVLLMGLLLSKNGSVGQTEDQAAVPATLTQEVTTEQTTETTQNETTTVTTVAPTTAFDAHKLYRPDSSRFVNQYTAYVFCTDTSVQDFVKMRYGPSKQKYDVVGTIPNYGEVVVETSSVDGWTLVFYGDKEGWVRSDFVFEGVAPDACDGDSGDKPVLYLYPEKKSDVSVKVNLKNCTFSCTYPEYGRGWKVTAYASGKLINHSDKKEYSYLYWELKGNITYDFSKGFVVKGKDTAAFLQKQLSAMGLTPKEYNEFIVYWLPKMQNNKYNLISFQTKAYTDNVALDITPKPDSMLRVFMAYKPLTKPVNVPAQKFKSFERKGFTVVEWGGVEVK